MKIEFTPEDLVKCMIRVDYQKVLIVDKKREDMMFDYVHDKFNNLKDDLTQSFILAIEGW